MWFKKRIDVVRTGVAEFMRVNGFSITYERQTLPDPGAMVYSYETLTLEPYTEIGPGIAVRQPTFFSPHQYPLYIDGKAVPLQGMPIVPGQLVHVPLLQEADLYE